MTDKKDLLEMDFGQVSIPQAIALTLGAAAKCWAADEKGVYRVNNDRLRELMDKLEAKFQDDLDAAGKQVETEIEAERFVSAMSGDVEIQLVYEEDDHDMIHQVVVNGVVFGKFCNEPVHHDNETGLSTFCIKQWAHLNPEHEDLEGRLRL